MVDQVTASAQFTPAENLCLLEEFGIYKDFLIRKFSEGCNNKRKSDMEKIGATMNSVNPTVEKEKFQKLGEYHRKSLKTQSQPPL